MYGCNFQPMKNIRLKFLRAKISLNFLTKFVVQNSNMVIFGVLYVLFNAIFVLSYSYCS